MPAERGARPRRIEPWPVGLALALLAMVGICLSFWAIAAANPDPPVTREARPGLER